MARLLELDTAVAAGFGAADAWVSTKSGAGPGGVPWAVILELGGVGAGMFGNRIGLSSPIENGLMLSSVSQLAARLTRAAMAGKLQAGPKAWGGTGAGAYNPQPYPQLPPAQAPGGARALPTSTASAQRRRGYEVAVEGPGIAG